MPSSPPNFSPFPFDRLPFRSNDEAAIESVLARWLARPSVRVVRGTTPVVTTPGHLAKLLGASLHFNSVALADRAFDPYAAFAEVRLGGLAITVAGSGQAVRTFAQRLLGGPDELAAPRSPTTAEQAIWSLVLAAALLDAGITAEVWPLAESAKVTLSREVREGSGRIQRSRDTDPGVGSVGLIGRGGLAGETPTSGPPSIGSAITEPSKSRIGLDPTVAGSRRRGASIEHNEAPSGHASTVIARRDVMRGDEGVRSRPLLTGPIAVEIVAEVAGIPVTAVAWCPPELLARVPPAREPHDWTFELPIVIARSALQRDAVAALAVRDVIVVEPGLELAIGDGGIGLTAVPQAVEAKVATGYVPRDMALPDEAHLELTVRLGTTRMSLRRIGELAVGEVVGLGKPLAGPYEIHAGGRAIGQGELVDLEGEIGVRIVSLIEE